MDVIYEKKTPDFGKLAKKSFKTTDFKSFLYLYT